MSKLQYHCLKKTNNTNFPNYRINNEIKIFGNVRLTGDNFESYICSIKEAREVAKKEGLDLIEIAPNAEPPVVKIASYDKMIYNLKKAAKKNKQTVHPLKEIQLSANIALHDMETKVNHARKFLESGSRVKVVLKLKGREMTRREENKKSILEFITMLDDVSVPESLPKDEGNKTIVILKKK